MNYNIENNIKNIQTKYNELNAQKADKTEKTADDLSIFEDNTLLSKVENVFTTKVDLDNCIKRPNIIKNAINSFISQFTNEIPDKEYLLIDKNTGYEYKLIESSLENGTQNTIKDIYTNETLQERVTSYLQNGDRFDDITNYQLNGKQEKYETLYNKEGDKYFDKHSLINKDGKENYVLNTYNTDGLSSRKIKDSNTITEEEYQNGFVIRTDNYELSDEDVILNHTSTDFYGNTITLSQREEDENNINVNKNFTSPDGSETFYSYQKDENGSSSLYYEIVDKNGNTLMNTQRTYQKLNEDEAISTYNGKEYHISIDDEKVTVSDVMKNEQTVIDLNQLVENSNKNISIMNTYNCTKDNEDFKDMIKSQPGDVLINLAEETNKIGKIKAEPTEKDNGEYSTVLETILSTSKDFVLNHELGHAIDYVPLDENNNYTTLSLTPDFQKIFEEEMDSFWKEAPRTQYIEASYLMDAQEFAAEARMLTTTNSTSERAEIIQMYFPKSITYINTLMDNIDKVDTRKLET